MERLTVKEYKLQLSLRDCQYILEALQDACLTYYGPAFCSLPARDDAKANRIYDVWVRIQNQFKAQKPEDRP